MIKLFLDADWGTLDDFILRLDIATKEPFILDDAGAFLLNRTRTRFLREKDPDLIPWVPSKAAIQRRRGGGTGTLFDTGRLFRSIQLSGSGYDDRQIGSDVPYGIFHQFGLGQVQRRFLGFGAEDIKLVELYVARNIEKRVE